MTFFGNRRADVAVANVICIRGANGFDDLYVFIPAGRSAIEAAREVDSILSTLKAEMRKGKTGNLDAALTEAGFEYADVLRTMHRF